MAAAVSRTGRSDARILPVVHCSGCGFIIGRNVPDDLSECPRCERVLRVQALAVNGGYDSPYLVAVDGPRPRRVALFVSEATLRFLLSTRTARTAAWEVLWRELEEERLRAFAAELGWAVAGVHRDPGPVAAEADRPFDRLLGELRDGLVNTVLVTDFARVTRRDLLRLLDMAQGHGGEVLQVAPHPPDPNLVHDNVDYHDVDDGWADHPPLARLWSEAADRAVDKLVDAAGWHWTAYAPDVLARTLGVDAVHDWRRADPLAREHGWREVLTLHAVARLKRRGLDRLALPRLLECVLCRRRYLDSALPRRLMELSGDRGGYCRRCLAAGFYWSEDGERSWVGPKPLDSAADADRVVAFFRGLERDRWHAFLATVLERRRAAAERRAEPPSNLWLGVASDLGFLRHLGPVGRSDIYYRASDGHLSATLGAALVDNWLAAHGLGHRPEARYPDGDRLEPGASRRADFQVGGALVEFAGLRGHDELGKDLQARLELARSAGLELVAIRAEDLLVAEVLDGKMEALAALARPGKAEGEQREQGKQGQPREEDPT